MTSTLTAPAPAVPAPTTWHTTVTNLGGIACLDCGAWWAGDGPEERKPDCLGFVDLVHGDGDAHVVDDCPAYREAGTCEHLAALLGCRCTWCLS